MPRSRHSLHDAGGILDNSICRKTYNAYGGSLLLSAIGDLLLAIAIWRFGHLPLVPSVPLVHIT